jgi:hypothetical protein
MQLIWDAKCPKKISNANVFGPRSSAIPHHLIHDGLCA